MCDLVARTGRHLQRYEDGRRLVAGCIPFRYRDIKDEQKKLVEVLMINSQSGPGLLFPKGGWENDETVEEAAAREAIEEAGVRGDLVICNHAALLCSAAHLCFIGPAACPRQMLMLRPRTPVARPMLCYPRGCRPPAPPRGGRHLAPLHRASQLRSVVQAPGPCSAAAPPAPPRGGPGEGAQHRQ